MQDFNRIDGIELFRVRFCELHLTKHGQGRRDHCVPSQHRLEMGR